MTKSLDCLDSPRVALFARNGNARHLQGSWHVHLHPVREVHRRCLREFTFQVNNSEDLLNIDSLNTQTSWARFNASASDCDHRHARIDNIAADWHYLICRLIPVCLRSCLSGGSMSCCRAVHALRCGGAACACSFHCIIMAPTSLRVKWGCCVCVFAAVPASLRWCLPRCLAPCNCATAPAPEACISATEEGVTVLITDECQHP